MSIGYDQLYIVYDIETVAAPNAWDLIKDKTNYKLGNVKDPEKIKAKIAENRQNDLDKAGLFWPTGNVCCICGYSLENHEAFSMCGPDEVEVIKGFFGWVRAQRQHNEILVLIGKSSRDFDRGFLVGRAMANDLGLITELRSDRADQDIDSCFGFSRSHSQVTSLNNYAFGLGIDGKLDGMDGSQVQGLFDAGEYDKIREYCAGDVMLTAEILQRYLKVF